MFVGEGSWDVGQAMADGQDGGGTGLKRGEAADTLVA